MTGLLNGVKTPREYPPCRQRRGWDMTGLLNGVKTHRLPALSDTADGWDMTGLLNGVKTLGSKILSSPSFVLGYDRTFERG